METKKRKYYSIIAVIVGIVNIYFGITWDRFWLIVGIGWIILGFYLNPKIEEILEKYFKKT